MDVRRLRIGEWLAGVGSVGLLVTLFLPWYRAAVFGALDRAFLGGSAWESFAVIDVVLLLVGLLGLTLAIATATQRAPAIPVAFASFATAGAIVGLVVVLYRLLDQPGPNELVEVRFGAYLGLLSLLALLAGGWWTMADERPETDTRPLVAAQPPPPATAPEGSAVARGVAPDAAPQRGS